MSELWQLKSLRHYSHHGIAFIIHREVLSDNALIPSKMPLPKPVAQDHNLIAAWPVFFGKKRPPQNRVHSEQGEEAGGNGPANNSFRLVATRQIKSRRPEGCELLKWICLVPPRQKIGNGKRVIVSVRSLLVYRDELGGIGIGQGSQQHAVDDTE